MKAALFALRFNELLDGGTAEARILAANNLNFSQNAALLLLFRK
jgi:hypothetical protein